MKELIKEIFWFQILNKCPNCKTKVVPHYTNGSFPPYHCLKCGWGEVKKIKHKKHHWVITPVKIEDKPTKYYHCLNCGELLTSPSTQKANVIAGDCIETY